jgi:hypothetical protein
MTQDVASIFGRLLMSLDALARKKDGLAAMQSIVAMIASGVTAIAIIVGAIWFLQQGQAKKRLVLTETLKTFAYENEMNWKLLSVSVIAENTGHVPVRLSCARVQITEIAPEYKKELAARKGETCNWDFPGGIEIDPGEKQQLYKEFYVPGDVVSVRASMSLPDVTDKDLYGWTVTETTIFPESHDIKGAK